MCCPAVLNYCSLTSENVPVSMVHATPAYVPVRCVASTTVSVAVNVFAIVVAGLLSPPHSVGDVAFTDSDPSPPVALPLYDRCVPLDTHVSTTLNEPETARTLEICALPKFAVRNPLVPGAFATVGPDQLPLGNTIIVTDAEPVPPVFVAPNVYVVVTSGETIAVPAVHGDAGEPFSKQLTGELFAVHVRTDEPP